LLPGVLGSKPKPLMTICVALTARLAVLDVTTGVTVATWTADGLLVPLTDTVAVSAPDTRPVKLVTVSCVYVAAVTVPVAPVLKVTTLLPAVLSSNPLPVMMSCVALAARVAVLEVIVGIRWTTVGSLAAAVLGSSVSLGLPVKPPV